MKRELIATALLSLCAPAGVNAESPRGLDDYATYCSACHGAAADGKGPVANVLEPPPPALTRLHRKYGNPLGTDLVVYILGTTMPRAHGTSDMPVWGKNLREPDGDNSRATQTIWRIVDYLESIQAPE